MDTLKISTKSRPSSIAGALANAFKTKNIVEMQAIGAGAINQAVKGVAIARGFIAPMGKDIIVVPAFSDITIDGATKTAIKLIVKAI